MSRFNYHFIRARIIIMILMLLGFVWSLFASYEILPRDLSRFPMDTPIDRPRFDPAIAEPTDWRAYLNPYNFSAMLEDGNTIWFASPMGLLKYNRIANSASLVTTANSGLNSNYISDMMIHSSGDIWFAHVAMVTDDDVCGGISILRTDGTWTVLNYENAPFSSNIINCLGEDIQGRVWVGYSMNGYHQGGMSCYDPQSGTWTYYSKHNSAMPANTVLSFHLASDGALWATFTGDVDPDPYEGGGLLRIVGDDWQAFDDEIVDDPEEELKYWEIKNIAEDSAGNLWFALTGSVDTALFKYDGYQFTRYAAPYETSYWDVAIDSADNIYVNGLSSVVNRFDQTNWETLPDPNSVVEGYYIQNIWVDSQDRIWVAKYDDSLVTFENGEFTMPNTDPGIPVKGINNFWCMDSDANGNTYFGTGWYVWGDLPTRSSLLHYDESQWYNFNYDDYQNYVVNDVAWALDGSLLIATGDSNDSAALLFDMYGSVCRRTDSGWIHYDTSNTGYPFIYAKLAQEDYNGYIWAGTNNMGLAVYDMVDWTVYDNTNVPNFSDSIKDILASHTEPVVWVACTSGLFRVDISDPANFVWEHFHPQNSNLPTWLVTSLAFAEDGSLWIGTDDGLAQFTADGLRNIAEFSNVSVTDLCIDEHGGLWISSIGNGLLHYREGVVSAYTRENSPLPTNMINQVCADYRGTLWINPHNGGLYAMSYSYSSQEDAQSPIPELQVQNFPNPFNPDTVISFEVPETGKVEVGIYNLKGQLVKSYPAFMANKGRTQLGWNGVTDSGYPCSSGVYLVRVKTRDNQLIHKMTLMK